MAGADLDRAEREPLGRRAPGADEPAHAAAVSGRADFNWRSWMRPFGIGLACSAWAPPRASEATKNIRVAIGQIAQGHAPTVPPAPHLRLVLDELNVLRPVGQRLPWE